MTNEEKFRHRADEIGKWLDEHAPEVQEDQRHLSEGSAERAYWHHGYRAALLDVLAKTAN